VANVDRREILSRVAAGQITPEEAASQLEAIKHDEPDQSAIRKVRVVKQFGTLEIVADPTVREAVAEGPHRARIDGDVMVLEGEAASDWGGFFFGGGRDWAHQTLRIRMNPALPLDLQVQAGTCRVRGVEAPIRADIQAGSATIDGFRNELDVSVQAGSLKASGRLDEGDSRINCNAGSVSLHLQRGSSVRIKARTNLGKVELPGEASLRQNRSAQEAIIGDGGGSLLIEGNMGSVRVTADG
jgi:hypothetical protein